MEHQRVAFEATRLRFRMDQDKIHVRERAEETRALPLGDQDRCARHAGPLRGRWWTRGTAAHHKHAADAGPTPASGLCRVAGIDERHPSPCRLGRWAFPLAAPPTAKILALSPLVFDWDG